MVAHTCSPSTWKAESGELLSWSPVSGLQEDEKWRRKAKQRAQEATACVKRKGRQNSGDTKRNDFQEVVQNLQK